jgi:hypothetical protein
VLLRSQEGFRNAPALIGWKAQCLGKKKLVAGGILLAICATAGYILLHENANLEQIKKRITDRLEFHEELCA